MIALKKHPKTFAAVFIAIVILAFVAASWLLASPEPTVPVNINGDFVGICVHSLSANDARLVNASGARWVRIDASENMTNFGASLRNAKAYNLSVLCILDSWMFNQSTAFTLDQWRASINYYVSKYADFVDAWEIWNEPANPNVNWTLQNLALPSQENMSKIVDFYYSMAQTAYPIIRQYDPNATILLFGGLHLYTGGDETILELDRNFSSQLAAKHIQQYGDAISLHAYPCNQPDQAVELGYSDSLVFYKGLFPSFPIWVTETGKPIHEAGEAGQANYLNFAFRFFSGSGSHVFWYSLKDNEGENGNFGLIGNDSTSRPAYFGLQKQILP